MSHINSWFLTDTIGGVCIRSNILETRDGRVQEWYQHWELGVGHLVTGEDYWITYTAVCTQSLYHHRHLHHHSICGWFSVWMLDIVWRHGTWSRSMMDMSEFFIWSWGEWHVWIPACLCYDPFKGKVGKKMAKWNILVQTMDLLKNFTY